MTATAPPAGPPPGPADDSATPGPAAGAAGGAAAGRVGAGELQRAAAAGAVWTVLHTIVSVPLAFAANAVVARVLGPEDYGRLAVITLVMAVTTVVANAGVLDGVVQWGAAAHARGDGDAVERLLQRSAGFHLLVQFPLVAIAALVLLRDAPALAVVAAAAGAAVAAFAATAVLACTLENRTAAGAQLTMVTNVVLQTVVVAAATLTRLPASVWAARSAAAALLQLPYLLVVSRRAAAAALRPLPPRGMPPGFWRFSLLTGAGAVVGMLVFSRTELVVLDAMDLAAAAGLFALAFGLSQQITAPIDALLNPLWPAVAGVVEVHPEKAARTLLRATRVSAVLAAGLVAVAFPALYLLVPLVYGEAFRPAADLFLPLGVASCLQSVVNPLLTFARARRRSGSLLVINLAALALNVGSAIALVPLIGVWGAVAANAVGQLAVLLPLARMECRHWGVTGAGYARALAPFAVAIGAMLVAAQAIPALLPLPAVPAAALAAAAGAALVVAGLRLTGTALPAEDVEPGVRVLPAPLQDPARRVARLLVAPVARQEIP